MNTSLKENRCFLKPGLDAGNEDKIKRGSKKFPSLFIYLFSIVPQNVFDFLPLSGSACSHSIFLSHARSRVHTHTCTYAHAQKEKQTTYLGLRG